MSLFSSSNGCTNFGHKLTNFILIYDDLFNRETKRRPGNTCWPEEPLYKKRMFTRSLIFIETKTIIAKNTGTTFGYLDVIDEIGIASLAGLAEKILFFRLNRDFKTKNIRRQTSS